jgi:hypothetical protein
MDESLVHFAKLTHAGLRGNLWGNFSLGGNLFISDIAHQLSQKVVCRNKQMLNYKVREHARRTASTAQCHRYVEAKLRGPAHSGLGPRYPDRDPSATLLCRRRGARLGTPRGQEF